VSPFLVHVLLFLALLVPIVVLSAFYSEPEDGPALRSVPRRFAVYLASSAAVAGVMLLLERVFASVEP
jgi:hypothetical protein